MLNYYLLAAVSIIFIVFVSNSNISLFVLAFSVPFINWIFKIYSLEIPFSDVIAIISVLAWLFNILFVLIFKPGQKIKINFPLFFPFLFFIIAAVISLFNHSQPLSGFYYIIRWLILLYVAYILLPVNLIKDKRSLKTAVIALALSSLLVTISGWLSLWGQDWQSSFFRIYSLQINGVYPFGYNHNLIAEFLCVGAFIWLALKEFGTDDRWRRICIVITLFTAAAAIFTFSRAAWITLSIQTLVYLLWHERESLKRHGGLMLLTGLMLIVMMIPVFWRMSILQADNVSSTENRVLLTEIAYEAWRDKPLTGQGIGRFTDLVANNIRFTAKYGAPIDSHGFLQKIMAETGILGLIAWLFLIIVITKKVIVGIKRYDKKVPWLFPLCVAAGGGLFFQIFNTSYYKGKVWLIITLALAAIAIAEKQYGKKD